jgi:hypothetical protein
VLMRVHSYLVASGRRPVVAVVVVGLALVALVAYAWWGTGTRPFTLVADLAVGIPVVLVAVMAFPDRESVPDAPPTALRRILPWLLLGGAAVTLEAIALALGGRSRAFPTLSTVIDQALAWHAARSGLFVIWMLAAAWPFGRRLRKRGSRE